MTRSEFYTALFCVSVLGFLIPVTVVNVKTQVIEARLQSIAMRTMDQRLVFYLAQVNRIKERRDK